jgi:hypothetical protein
MRLSIRQVLAPMALLVTALVSMGMAPVDPAPLSPATPSTCSSYIDWNAEKGVWRINCGDSASCCEYETVRKLDGSYLIWCDCTIDGFSPECCHPQLRVFPNDPGRPAMPAVEGHCDGECGTLPWAGTCRFVELSGGGSIGGNLSDRTKALCVSN